MSNYYEYEEFASRRRPQSRDRDRDRDRDHDRDFSPENYSGGANNAPPGAPPYPSASRLDDPYAGAAPPPRERMTLEPPPSQARPRSVPPQGSAMVRRGRSRASSFASSDDDDYRRRGSKSRSRSRKRSPSPMSRARGVVDDNFTNSSTGLGASLLGAVVGGLVAREASDAATRRKHKTRGYEEAEPDRTRMISTILGAVAGGLGANAIANRVEDSRDRDRRRLQDWEQERRSVREEEMPRYDQKRTGRSRDLDDEPIRDRGERRIMPPRNDDEDDYDFVYDEPRYDDRRPDRRRSEENYRYRQ